MRKDILVLSMMLGMLMFAFSPLRADGKLGIRGGIYTDAEEAFIGGEFLSSISPRIDFNPNVEYIFTDGLTFMTFNGDFHYDLPVATRNYVWAGAGLGVSYINPKGSGDSHTDTGLNLIFGIGFPSRDLIPYLQLKVMVGDVDDLVLGFGIRF